ncbi:hypothetical protein BJI67_07470 [Acidihalobacter aeolianus]|uniref:Phosphoglycerate mutase n=1 Tax=Acidihalobacter aeolianus TaxID=2792603 RepID=A0A1D8K7I2_9GAMM|nr:hypothetical protein BJI67_07470 [Acidihalobacter aeolianus]
MRLHLIVPGLLRPLAPWLRDYAWRPQAEALSQLLAGAGETADTRADAFEMAAVLLGWEGAEGHLPAAGYRTRAHDLPVPSAGDWLCADPIHLKADANDAQVVDRSGFTLRLDEAGELIELLENILGGDGWHFHLGSAHEWYLQTPRGMAPHMPMLSQVAGRHPRREWQAADIPREWHTRLTEMQMVLYQAAVNRAREARGEPVINSLWCWGKGDAVELSGGGVTAVMGDGNLLAGLAQAANLNCIEPKPEALDAADKAETILLLEMLAPPAAYDDLNAWDQTLKHADVEWFEPLLARLETRRIDEIVLYADGRSWQIRKRGFLQRLRAPQPLARALNISDPA